MSTKDVEAKTNRFMKNRTLYVLIFNFLRNFPVKSPSRHQATAKFDKYRIFAVKNVELLIVHNYGYRNLLRRFFNSFRRINGKQFGLELWMDCPEKKVVAIFFRKRKLLKLFHCNTKKLTAAKFFTHGNSVEGSLHFKRLSCLNRKVRESNPYKKCKKPVFQAISFRIFALAWCEISIFAFIILL
jgi:hypothetical protein